MSWDEAFVKLSWNMKEKTPVEERKDFPYGILSCLQHEVPAPSFLEIAQPESLLEIAQ